MSNVIILAEVLRRERVLSLPIEHDHRTDQVSLDEEAAMNEAATVIRRLRQERDDAMRAAKERDVGIRLLMDCCTKLHRKAQRAFWRGMLWGALAVAGFILVAM